MISFNVVRFILVLLLLQALISTIQARADNVLAQQYVHARNMLAETPGTETDLQNDQNSSAPVDRTYELSGKVTGQVTSDGQPIVILSCNNMTVEFSAPQAFLDSTSDWTGTGNLIRVLVHSDAVGASGNGVLNLLAAGPEGDVSALEKQLSALENQLRTRIQARQFTQETSRSATMSSRWLASPTSVLGLSPRAAAIYPAYRNKIAALNPRLSSSSVDVITRSVLGYADAYQLDPRLIIAMIVAESDFDPYSVSRTGAVGLGQLMPETAAELGVTDRFDPQQNISAAVRILSTHVQQYGGAAPCGVVPANTLLLTMAAYNAGPGAVKKYGGVPPYRETQNYVKRVSQLYRELCGN